MELVWLGAIQPAEGAAARRTDRLLKSLLPVKFRSLTALTGIDGACVLPDETELLPALPLGDVLAEELDLDLPYGTLIVIHETESNDHPDEMSYHLGGVIGEALLGVLRSGTFPLEREAEALYVMACSYHRLVEGTGFRHLGLIPERFRAGLAASLGAYWSGARSSRTETSGLFVDPDFLASAELRAYLKCFDAGFEAPAFGRVPASLMTFPGGTRSYDDWVALVYRAVSAMLGPSGAPSVDAAKSLTRRGL